MNKRKLGYVLAILFVSATAATAGTLAWFSAVRTATITYSDAKVTTQESSLIIEYKESLNSLTDVVFAADEVSQSLTMTGDFGVTDISGDGLTFYRPVWSATNNIASSIKTIDTSTAGSADEHFIDFTITLKRNPTDVTGLKVFLGPETKILPKDSGSAVDVATIKATRMAVIRYSDGTIDTGTPSVAIYYAPEAETGATYLQAGSGGAYGLTTHEFASGVTLSSTPFVKKYTIAESEALYPAVANLMTTYEEDVTFRYWIEGTDVHATDDIIGGVFKITVDLYALSA